jgi:hypothetical protein
MQRLRPPGRGDVKDASGSSRGAGQQWGLAAAAGPASQRRRGGARAPPRRPRPRPPAALPELVEAAAAAAGPLGPLLRTVAQDAADAAALQPSGAGVARLSVRRLGARGVPGAAWPRRAGTWGRAAAGGQSTGSRCPRPRIPPQALADFLLSSPNPLAGLLDFYVLGPLTNAASPKYRTRDFVVREKWAAAIPCGPGLRAAAGGRPGGGLHAGRRGAALIAAAGLTAPALRPPPHPAQARRRQLWRHV